MEFEARWATSKNQSLRARHGIGFEEVLIAIAESRVLADVAHENAARYPNQRMLVVEIDRYAWAVPYVNEGERPFFKTLFPSRKLNRRYLGDAP
jgi:uncharacterized DUF497 family protein